MTSGKTLQHGVRRLTHPVSPGGVPCTDPIFRKPHLPQTTGSYPGTTATVSGSVTVSATLPIAPLTIYYRLTGMTPSAAGGLHIHTRTAD